jgi:hypothetical protein
VVHVQVPRLGVVHVHLQARKVLHVKSKKK